MKILNNYILIENICICTNCKCNLNVTYKINLYSGGPFLCSNCKTDVTKLIYGN